MKQKKRKLQTKLLRGLLGMAIILMIVLTPLIANLYRLKMEAQYKKTAFDQATIAANLIDGDRIRDYYESGVKDDYYETVRQELLMMKQTVGLKYFYVVVPQDKDMYYIWDAGADGEEGVCELGDTEEYYGGGDIVMKEAFSTDAEQHILVTNNKLYGYLASAYVPIKDSSGTPVALASVDMSMDVINAHIRQFVGTVTGVIFVVLILSSAFFHFYTRKVVMEPLNQLHTATSELVNSQMDHLDQFTNQVQTGDELQELGERFEFMTRELDTYIHNLAKATAEKERIGAELDLATRIQANMLPNIFPAFPERADFDIYASMTPAKEVGGDFYDFFLIDDDHLGMVIADVSGKGVPAALFMMMSMILVNNTARMEGPNASPGAVLTKVNNTICANNSEEMFVTVWLGILTISTGRVVAANAGHEYPMLKKADGSFELFKDRHGLVVGAMEGIRFRDYEFTLEKGGALFVYTDGVAEATDAHDELFGTERTLAALNQNPDASPKALLENVKGAVDRFVGEAPQFDDLTMLSVKRN